MNALDWVVIAGGVAAIAWVNWYFLLAAPRERHDATSDAANSRAGDEHHHV